MSTIENITAAYTRKVQLDQFEPVTYFAEATVKLDGDEDPQEVYDETREDLEDMVERGITERVTQTKLESEDDDEE